MKNTISLHDMRDAFRRVGREDQFSYSGMEVLFQYIEDMEQDCGIEFEFDVIGLCSDYAEDTPESIAAKYDIDISDLDDPADIFERVGEYVNEYGAYCGVTDEGNIIYQQF